MKELQFTCPKCGHHELGSVEQVIRTFPIAAITGDADLEYNYEAAESGDGNVVAYQCLRCGFELQDEKGNAIQDCMKVVEWIKKNCSEDAQK